MITPSKYGGPRRLPDMKPNALQSQEAVELLGGMVICFCFTFMYGIAGGDMVRLLTLLLVSTA